MPAELFVGRRVRMPAWIELWGTAGYNDMFLLIIVQLEAFGALKILLIHAVFFELMHMTPRGVVMG